MVGLGLGLLQGRLGLLQRRHIRYSHALHPQARHPCTDKDGHYIVKEDTWLNENCMSCPLCCLSV